MKIKLGAILVLVLSIIMSTQVFAELQLNTGKVVSGRTMIPLRGAFEELGFDVTWDNATNSATLKDANHTILVKKGDNNFNVDGQVYVSDVAPKLINGTLYIPLRTIGDKIGATTSWNAENEFAKIEYNNDRTFIYAPSQTLGTNSNMGEIATLEMYLDVLEQAQTIYKYFGEAMTYMETDQNNARLLLANTQSLIIILENVDLTKISDDAENAMNMFTENLWKSADECIKYLDGKEHGASIEVLQSYYLNSNEYAHYAAAGYNNFNTMFETYWGKVKSK